MNRSQKVLIKKQDVEIWRNVTCINFRLFSTVKKMLWKKDAFTVYRINNNNNKKKKDASTNLKIYSSL